MSFPGVGFCYAIIGSGMQGTAAAYDLAQFGDADEIRLFDQRTHIAEAAAERVHRLVGRSVCRAHSLDAQAQGAVESALQGVDACLSAAPFYLNERLAAAAISAGACFNDLGGNTAVVERELALDPAAKAAGVSVIPDCGVAPGMANSIAVYGMSQLDTPAEVHMYTGGLPQNRNLPLGYKVLFVLDGLTNEYFGKALALRRGKVVEIDTFEELESVDFGGKLGALEAFTTSGGTSTAPKTFAGKLDTYQYKTLRYPGHYEALKMLRDMGFIEPEPVDVNGQKVIPKDLFHVLMTKYWNFPDEPDLLVQRVDVIGKKNGAPARFRMQLIDYQDAKTGFSAMERTTAYSAAIVTAMQAKKVIPAGAYPVESGVPAEAFVEALKRRGFELEIGIEPL